MIKIGILGDIGSGKSFVSTKFGYPVFNADAVVSKLYKKNKKIYIKLNKILPNYINSFPVEKKQISQAILANNTNLKKIVNIVHKEVRKEMNLFLNMQQRVMLYIDTITNPFNNEVIIRSLNLNSLLMFITSPFEDVKIARKRFIINLIENSLSAGDMYNEEFNNIINLFNDKYTQLSRNVRAESSSSIIDKELSIPTEIKIDFVAIAEQEDEKRAENTSKKNFLLLENKRQVTNGRSNIEDEKLKRAEQTEKGWFVWS